MRSAECGIDRFPPGFDPGVAMTGVELARGGPLELNPPRHGVG